MVIWLMDLNRLFWVFHKLLISCYIHTQQSLWFTQNSVNNKETCVMSLKSQALCWFGLTGHPHTSNYGVNGLHQVVLLSGKNMDIQRDKTRCFFFLIFSFVWVYAHYNPRPLILIDRSGTECGYLLSVLMFCGCCAEPLLMCYYILSDTLIPLDIFLWPVFINKLTRNFFVYEILTHDSYSDSYTHIYDQRIGLGETNLNIISYLTFSL